MKTQFAALLTLVSAAYSIPSQPVVWENAIRNSRSVSELTAVPPKAAPVKVSPLAGYTYLGCRTDAIASRILGEKYTWSHNMTYAACSKFCVNYEYIGLEYETECYCGSSIPVSAKIANETECGMSCSGDKTAKCGGANRISVFKATPFMPSAPANVKGYAYRGCYADAVGKRILKDGYYYGKNVTTAGCAASCKYSTYFGTEYGGECYCGSTLSLNAKQVDANQCKAQCVGSTTQACGDANRLSLYWKTP